MKSILFVVLKCAEIKIPVGIPIKIGDSAIVPKKPYFLQRIRYFLNFGSKPALFFFLNKMLKTCVLKLYMKNNVTKVALKFIASICQKLNPESALNIGPE